MAGWSGPRVKLTIILFLLPTLLAILAFNVYPLVLNTYISFTNRNKFRPNPDCTAGLNGVLDPLCWPVFASGAPKGLGNPYKPIDPPLKNYDTLMGKLFTPESLLSLLKILIVIAPLFVANSVNHRLDRALTRPIAPGMVWLIAIVAV